MWYTFRIIWNTTIIHVKFLTFNVRHYKDKKEQRKTTDMIVLSALYKRICISNSAMRVVFNTSSKPPKRVSFFSYQFFFNIRVWTSSKEINWFFKMIIIILKSWFRVSIFIVIIWFTLSPLTQFKTMLNFIKWSIKSLVFANCWGIKHKVEKYFRVEHFVREHGLDDQKILICYSNFKSNTC